MTALGLAVELKARYIASAGIVPVFLEPCAGPVERYQEAGALWYEESDDTRTPEARGSYAALEWECWQQFTLLTSAIDVEFCDDDPTPLGDHGGPSFAKLKQEVDRTGKLRVFRSDGVHPLLDRPGAIYTHKNRSESATSIFRAVHDFFGHLATGGSFGWNGETTAYYSHAAMFSAAALPALFSETTLQQCYYAIHRDYAPQKAVIFPVTVPQPPLM